MADSWPSVVKAWVLKVPGLAILAALIFCVALIALFLFSTPVCESRSFFGITTDRTKLAQCAQPSSAAPSTSAGETSGNPTTAQPPVAALPPPIATAAPIPPADVAFNATGREDFRKRNALGIVETESASLGETPSNSYGFAYGGSFATVWKDKLDTLTIRSSSRSVHFEMQKRGAGVVYIVGFMRGDSAKEMQANRAYPERIRLYSERYRTTDAIVAIPVQAIKSVGQSTIDISETKYIPVLDLGFK